MTQITLPGTEVRDPYKPSELTFSQQMAAVYEEGYRIVM